jgi:hypothetical protein
MLLPRCDDIVRCFVSLKLVGLDSRGNVHNIERCFYS